MQFANITETRTRMATLTKQVLKDGLVVLLKNGKPILGLLDYKEIEEYEEWKVKKKKEKEFEEWLISLPEKKITKEEAKSIAEARKSKDASISLEEFLKR